MKELKLRGAKTTLSAVVEAAENGEQDVDARDKRGHDERKTCPLTSAEVEAIKVHHLVPRSHKVMNKPLLRVRASVDFREGAELGV